MKSGFTLMELLVVIGMIAILTGAASSSVMKARKRSQIARAEAEVREITNAILAYENLRRPDWQHGRHEPETVRDSPDEYGGDERIRDYPGPAHPEFEERDTQRNENHYP